MEDGGLNGGDTCSPINCGTVSVNNSNQCPSVELFLDDNVLVQCHDGYSSDGKPKRSNFTVTSLKSGERDGEGICAAVSDGSSAVFGESITWTCDEGCACAETDEGQFSLTCASNGKFSGQGVCSKVVRSAPSVEKATVTAQIDSESNTYGTTYTAMFDTGYVISNGSKSFVFQCAGSVSEVLSCNRVTCDLAAVTLWMGPLLAQNFNVKFSQMTTKQLFFVTKMRGRRISRCKVMTISFWCMQRKHMQRRTT